MAAKNTATHSINSRRCIRILGGLLMLVLLVSSMAALFSVGFSLDTRAEGVVYSNGDAQVDSYDFATYPYYVYDADGKFLMAYKDDDLTTTGTNEDAWDGNTSSSSSREGAVKEAVTSASNNATKKWAYIRLMANADSRRGNYNNATYSGGGTVYVDLNGYTLTTYSGNLFGGESKGAQNYSNYWKIYNGTVINASTLGITRSAAYGADYANSGMLKPYVFTFENVRFEWASGSTVTNMFINYYDIDTTTMGGVDCDGREVVSRFALNNCTFDLTNAPISDASFYLFNSNDTTYRLNGASDGSDTTVTLNSVCNMTVSGGTIIAPSINFKLYSQNTAIGSYSNFGTNSEGDYLKLSLPTGATAPAAALAGNSADGEFTNNTMTFGRRLINSGGRDIYEILPPYTFTGDSETKTTIPAYTYYANYFHVFDNATGNLLGSFEQWSYDKDGQDGKTQADATSAFGYVWHALRPAGTDTMHYTIVMTNDFHYWNGYFANFGHLRGTLTFDLGGYEFHNKCASDDRLFNFEAKGSSAGSTDDTNAATGKYQPTNFNVKNGAIINYYCAPMTTSAYGGYLTADVTKTFNVNFTDVTFAYSADNTLTSKVLVNHHDVDASNAREMILNLTLEDCTFDMTNISSAATLFDANDTKYTGTGSVNSVTHITVRGGEVISKNTLTDFTLYAENSDNGSTVGFFNSANTSFALDMPKPYDCPTEAYLTDTGRYCLDLTAGGGAIGMAAESFRSFTAATSAISGNARYELADSAFEKYGYVPAYYSDIEEYPYAVFAGISVTSDLQCIGVYSGWKDTTVSASGNAYGTDGSTVLVRHSSTLTSQDVDNGKFAASRYNANIVIDLNSNTLTQTGNAYFLDLYYSTDNADTDGMLSITVNDGAIVNNGAFAPISIDASSDFGAGTGNVIFSFNSVSFSDDGEHYGPVFILWEQEAATFETNGDYPEITVDATFTDCNISSSNTTYPAVMLTGCTGNANATVVDINATFIGGSVTSALSPFIMKDDEDTLTFAERDGEYTKLIHPNTVTKPTQVFDGTSGLYLGDTVSEGILPSGIPTDGLSFVFSEDSGSNKIYELSAAGATDYGPALAYYMSDKDAYPFLLFNNGALIGAYSCWADSSEAGGGSGAPAGVLTGAKRTLDNLTNGEVTVLLRRDYDIVTGVFDNLSHFKGTFVFDLAGYTLRGGTRALYAACNKTTRTNLFITKNGTILLDKGFLISLQASEYAAESLMSFEFNNVTIGFADGATSNSIITTYSNDAALAAGVKARADIVFNDCIFDLKTNVTVSHIELFELADDDGAHFADITIAGGNITVGDLSDFGFDIDGDGTNDADGLIYHRAGEDTVVFSKSATTDEYPTVTVDEDTSAPDLYFGNADVDYIGMLPEDGILDTAGVSDDVKSFKLDSTAGGQSTYVLTDAAATDYGTVPAYYYYNTESYPFFVFAAGECVLATEKYATDDDPSSAIDKVRYYSEVVENFSGELVILLNRDFDRNNTAGSAHYNNQNFIRMPFTVDLGENTFTLSGSVPLIFATQKRWWDAGSPTVKNGTVIMSGAATMVLFNTAVDSTGEYLESSSASHIDVILEDLNIIVAESYSGKMGSPIVAVQDLGENRPCQKSSVTLRNCNIDVSAYSGELVVFETVDTYGKVDLSVTVEGGNITGASAENVIITNDKTKVKFAADEGGDFTTLTLPSTSSAPTGVYNTSSGPSALTGISAGDAQDTVVYSFEMIAGLESFKIRSNITLASELITNIYIPVNANILSFAIDGVEYKSASLYSLRRVTLSGISGEFYFISVSMPADSAARDISVSVTMNTASGEFTGNYTVSVLKYAERIISGEYTNAAKTLMRDVISYVRSAYLYFGTAIATDDIALRMQRIIGDYERGFAMLSGESSDTLPGLSGATLVLGARPAFRFYIADGYEAESFVFSQGGEKLSAILGVDTEGREYLDVTLDANLMCDAVDYTAGGSASGSYHINGYYEYVTTDAELSADAALVDLVTKFYLYVSSVRDYVGG